MGRKFVVVALVTLAAASPSCNRGECENDDDCDDGLYCNGHEICSNSECMSRRPPDCDDRLPPWDCSCDEERDLCVCECLDVDGDGHASLECDGGDDCDDGDADVYPGAPERCNGRDDDCDTVVEEDMDGDGYYNDEDVCTDLDPADVDCDDTNRGVHPGAPEPCNERDDNCVDGIDDEADTDGDGHVEIDCASSPGGDDCDDEIATIHPGADDVCNGVDDDCDAGCDDGFECCMGEIMDCTTVCGSTGLGECTPECLPPDGTGCVPPPETCNGEDDDCDTVVDNDLHCTPGETAECTTTCGTTGLGVCTSECTAAPPEACAAPDETCNGEDDDCDTVEDEGFACLAGDVVECTTSCGSEGSGICTDDCTIPGGEDCFPPSIETRCNDGVDDDCDGWEDCWDEDCIGTIPCS
jgi:hypothetical protein